MERHQPGLRCSPKPAASLLLLPEACMHRIISFMDVPTKQAFFRVSKGSLNDPGCASLILAACSSTFNKTMPSKPSTGAAPSALLPWAGQISGAQIELRLDCGSRSLADVVFHLFIILGPPKCGPGPAVYPGITSLKLEVGECKSLLPPWLAAVFPNLRSIELTGWRLGYKPARPPPQHQLMYIFAPDPVPELGAIATEGFSRLQHLNVMVNSPHDLVVQHIAAQLAHLPALTTLEVSAEALELTPASLLRQLTSLTSDCDHVYGRQEPHTYANLQATLPTCTQLRSLSLSGCFKSVTGLLKCAPSSITTLCLDELTDDMIRAVLALPNLTTLSASTLEVHDKDFRGLSCSWRQLSFTSQCTDRIARMPMHTLDQPITCPDFFIQPSDDHAANMAAIRAAQPHLRRCGGIKLIGSSTLYFVTHDCPDITFDEADELLRAWAECVSTPDTVMGVGGAEDEDDGAYNDTHTMDMIELCVMDLWPYARLDWD